MSLSANAPEILSTFKLFTDDPRLTERVTEQPRLLRGVVFGELDVADWLDPIGADFRLNGALIIEITSAPF